MLPMPDRQLIKADELNQLRRQDIDLYCLDIRTREEHDRFRVRGFYPLDQFLLPAFLQALPRANAYIVLACLTGSLSEALLPTIINRFGSHNIFALYGGLVSQQQWWEMEE
jgi:hypothetical protein